MFFLTALLISLAFIRSTTAATADDWRSRSIYQYASNTVAPFDYSDEHPKESLRTATHFQPVRTQPLAMWKIGPGTSSFHAPVEPFLTSCRCGGSWNTIRENLDYIQNAGFTAIWISPINQNYEGPQTAYGDPYHGRLSPFP